MPSSNLRNSVKMKVLKSEKRMDSKHGFAIDPAVSLLRVNKILALSSRSIVFKQSREPKIKGKVYKAENGNEYYLPDPEIDVLLGDNMSAQSRAVQFLKDDDGQVSLQIQLVFKRPDNISTKPHLLIPTINSVFLLWGEERLKLSNPSYFVENQKSGYRFLVPISNKILDSLVRAMKDHSTLSTLQVSSHIEYQVLRNNVSSNTTRPRPRRSAQPIFHIATPEVLTFVPTVARARPSIAMVRRDTPAVATAIAKSRGAAVEKFKLNASVLKRLRRNTPTAPASQTVKIRKKRIQNNISISFSGQGDNEHHVYQALEDETSDHEFADRWQHTDFGVFSPASFPNRIYMMPHALRMAYNPDTLLPDITPVLYMSDEDEPRVRLRLGIRPWYDLEKVTQLRDFLTIADSSSFMYPELITNFSTRASLALTTQFTDGITALNEMGDIDINFSSFLSLDLDVTLEFYKFVTTMLGGAVGITGSLSVFLKSDDSDDDISDLENIENVIIPFSLKIDEIANPQLRFTPPETDDPDRPTKVVVQNTGGHDLVFKNVLPHLLYEDPNSIVPLNMFQSGVKQTLPIEIAAGASVEIEIDSSDALEDSVWNSIDMVMTQYDMVIDSKEVLKKTHDLMPPGDLTWELLVQAPPFMMDTLPDGMDNVFAVMVLIEISGRSPLSITLTSDNAEHRVTLSPSLNEIVDMDGSVDFLEYTYKTQTILSDRMLEWSTPITGRGSRIFVFPTTAPDG